MKLTVSGIPSTVIKSVTFEGNLEDYDGTAEIEFQNGSVYRYKEIPAEAVIALFLTDEGTVGENFQWFRHSRKNFVRIK